MQETHDIFQQARDKVCPSLVRQLFDHPGSEQRADELYILSPLRPDKSVGSFSINLNTGYYKDMATDEGGDLIDLVSKTKGMTTREAAEYIYTTGGGIIDTRPVNSPEAVEIPAVVPIPETPEMMALLKKRLVEQWAVDHWGKATNLYKYRNREGQWIYAVVRYQKENGKSTIPYYWTGDVWRAKKPESLKPYPPYKIETVTPDLPILIVEGEKCANIDVPGYHVVSWMGGTNRVQDTDWSCLSGHGKPIYIWPDADSQKDKTDRLLPIEKQPGMKAALYIAEQLPGSIVLPVYEEWPRESDPDGFDIADYVHAGGDPVEMIHHLLGYLAAEEEEEYTEPPTDPLETKIDPYFVYRSYIDHHFHGDCLDQRGGAFWEYSSQDHYWEIRNKKDLECNFRRWIEATGLRERIAKKQELEKFLGKCENHLNKHSNGFISDNPFADAACSPFIHVENGAIEILQDDVKWHDRTEKGEKFFRDLFPVHCLDFPFDPVYLDGSDISETAPAFWHFIKGLVPHEETEGLSEDEKDGLYREALMYIGQILAYSLSPIKPNEYFFAIHGDQSTGKSFFIKLLKSIIGGKFCIERPIADMDNRFAASGFWGKKVFIEPDMKARAPLPDGFIKSYAGEQNITIERKNEQPIENVKISLAIFLISNYDFVVRGTEGILRRFIYLPYKNRLDNPDRKLLDKIIGNHPKGKESGGQAGKTYDERPAILGLILECWRIFQMNNSEFTVPTWAEKEKERWMIDNSSTASFIEEFRQPKPDGYEIKRVDLYSEYKTWCGEEDRRALGKKNFFEELRRIDGITERRVNGLDFFIFERGE